MSDASNPSQSGLPVGPQALPEALGGAPAVPPQAPAQGQTGAPAVPPAPPPADVLLDAPPPPVTPNPDTTQEFTYDPTGDAGLDYALNLVGKLGYGDAHPAVIAAQKGDISLIRAELATKGVTVNVIAPGYVATKMVTAIREDILKTIVDSVPMKRLAKPEEIGFAVAFLASELSGFTTGATLNINGGLYYQ